MRSCRLVLRSWWISLWISSCQIHNSESSPKRSSSVRNSSRRMAMSTKELSPDETTTHTICSCTVISKDFFWWNTTFIALSCCVNARFEKKICIEVCCRKYIWLIKILLRFPTQPDDFYFSTHHSLYLKKQCDQQQYWQCVPSDKYLW